MNNNSHNNKQWRVVAIRMHLFFTYSWIKSASLFIRVVKHAYCWSSSTEGTTWCKSVCIWINCLLW